MNISYTVDDKEVTNNLDKLNRKIDNVAESTNRFSAEACLVLSRLEVPHDTGNLQNSGHTEKHGLEWWVVYNTQYASFQHEGIRADGTHAVLHYQKGRKKKYLEDPLKNNITKWQQIAQQELAKILLGKI